MAKFNTTFKTPLKKATSNFLQSSLVTAHLQNKNVCLLVRRSLHCSEGDNTPLLRIRTMQREINTSPPTEDHCTAKNDTKSLCSFGSCYSSYAGGGGTTYHLNGGRIKLSLNKYKKKKFGSFINYSKIIGYKFNSTFYQAISPVFNSLIVHKKQISPTSPYLESSPPASPATPSEVEDSYKAKKETTLFSEKRGETLNLINGLSLLGSSAYCYCYAGVTQIKGLEKSKGNIYIKDTYKLLFYLFKSMYCLISKPVLKYTNEKVTIQLFYYLNIPKKKVFRFFSIYYINSIKKKWLTFFDKKKTNFIYNRNKSVSLQRSSISKNSGNVTFLPLVARSRGNTKIYIKWKLRKAISRFKNKPLEGKNLLFNLSKFNLTAKSVYQNKFKLICTILSNKFNKPVELQLIRLHHPYHDSNILVNLLSLNIKNKRKKARVAIQKIYNKKPVKFLNDPNLKSSKFIPAFLSGLNIKIAGRLMGEPIIPRITTKVYGKGVIASGKVNYLDVAKITNKNKKGAYTIKITSGQNFF